MQCVIHKKSINLQRLVYLIVILGVFGCSTPHDVSQFNGYWKLQEICPSGQLTHSNLGLLRIENDTLYNFPLGNFNYGNCFMESSRDSLTLNRICGITRFQYQISNNGKTIRVINSNQSYQLTRADSIEITLKNILKQTQLNIDLPYSTSTAQITVTHPRLFYFGKKIQNVYHGCDSEKQEIKFTLDPEEELLPPQECPTPFFLPKEMALKYEDIYVAPCELAELKELFLNEIPDSEKLEIILCADKNVPIPFLRNFKSVFTHPRIKVLQLKQYPENSLQLKYEFL